MREPGDGLHGYDGSAMETTKAENASDHAEDQEEPGMEKAAASALTEEEEAPEEADPAIADGLVESLETAADEDEASAAAFEAEEPEPAAASDENALPEEIEAPASPAESPSDEPDEAVGSEMLSDEAIVFETTYFDNHVGAKKQQAAATQEYAPEFQDIHISDIVVNGCETGIAAHGAEGMVHDITVSNSLIFYNKTAKDIDPACKITLNNVKFTTFGE